MMNMISIENRSRSYLLLSSCSKIWLWWMQISHDNLDHNHYHHGWMIFLFITPTCSNYQIIIIFSVNDVFRNTKRSNSGFFLFDWIDWLIIFDLHASIIKSIMKNYEKFITLKSVYIFCIVIHSFHSSAIRIKLSLT